MASSSKTPVSVITGFLGSGGFEFHLGNRATKIVPATAHAHVRMQPAGSTAAAVQHWPLSLLEQEQLEQPAKTL
jgi:hypothetical protein